MDSIDLERIERRARLRYEWNRARWALLGVAPAGVLVAIAGAFGSSPRWPLTFGAVLFGLGALLLWYGRDLNRAVMPGLAVGLVPLTFSLCAMHVGHVCTGDHCMTVCLPACVAGGLTSGAALGLLGHRAKHGLAFWASASTISLLTGAMGCACIGMSGVLGLVLGFALGFAPVARMGFGVKGS